MTIKAVGSECEARADRPANAVGRAGPRGWTLTSSSKGSRAAELAAQLRARRAGGRGTSPPGLGRPKAPMPRAFMARPHKAKV